MEYHDKTTRRPEQLRRWIGEHQTSVNAWILFAITVVVVFIFLSDRDFSFLLTLSSLVSAFCFFMIAQKIERSGTCSGVSLKMMQCYLLLLAARLCSILPFEGYLPYDRTGDWLYQLTEVISLVLCGVIVYLCSRRYKSTYNPDSDSFKHLFLIIPALLLAAIFHPTLNAFVPADIAWTFALYLEAFACLPQLYYFQKEKRVEPFTSHFLAGQALSKILAFIFWVNTHRELNDPSKPWKSFAGMWVIIMQVVQLIVMGDFIYHYVRCVSRGVPVQFFPNENV